VTCSYKHTSQARAQTHTQRIIGFQLPQWLCQYATI